MSDDHRPSEFLAAEPVSTASLESVVANERTAAFKPPSLVGRLPQKEYDTAIVNAAIRLNAELDGCEIEAPGAIGEALRMLRNAVVNARRA